MSIKNKLGKNIGFYGDSYTVRPFTNFIGGPGRWENLSTDEQRLDFTYNINEDQLDTPADHPDYCYWWTYQLQQHFEKSIHYGISGTSQEHMLYDQIDVNNNRWSYEKQIPDVMICVWTGFARIFYDHHELNEVFSANQLNWLNQLGSRYQSITESDKKLFGVNKKLIDIVTQDKLIASNNVAQYRCIGNCITFDQYWSQLLKQRNPNVKIIHLQTSSKPFTLDKGNWTSTLKNNIWVKNFPLNDLSGDEADLKGRQYVGHFGKQWKHDLLYEKLLYLIENYDNLKGIVDGSNWQKTYKNSL